MEKELVVLLLCCAGALIAEGLPAQEQQVALEALEKELGNVKSSEVGFPTETVADEQGEDFPSDGEESAEEEGYSKSGAVYTRWGKTTCPSTARLVYFGVAAGAHYTHPGTAANYICLPHNPEYYRSGPPSRYTAYVYGAEYLEMSNPVRLAFLLKLLLTNREKTFLLMVKKVQKKKDILRAALSTHAGERLHALVQPGWSTLE